MKNVNELKQERASKLTQMSEINKRGLDEARVKTDAEKTLFDTLEKEVENLERMISDFEKQEELNKRIGNPVEVKSTEKQPVTLQFRDWLKTAVNEGRTSSFNTELRADPWITSTDTAIINKTINPGVDILSSPAEAFLRSLGVTFYPGLVGNYVIPSMAEDTALWPAEDASANHASMATSSLTLAARRVTHTQIISKETMNQTNPAIYGSILQNLYNGVWNAVTNDVFDTLETDAASQVHTKSTGTYVNFTDVLNLEASINGLNINKGAYVTTPTGKAYLKGTAGLTNQVAMWQGDTMNGYPAFGVPAANAKRLYFGDFSRMAVGQWGGLEIIVDPYTKAKNGEIILTVIGMFDTGCTNKLAFSWVPDTSLSA